VIQYINDYKAHACMV